MSQPLVEVAGLTKVFRRRGSSLLGPAAQLRAVDGVDLEIRVGETLALVGESGSGKTTFGRCILRLLEATAGEVRFEGEDLFAMSATRLRRRRCAFQMVFQDPFGSLNPRMRVGQILSEPLSTHEVVPRSDRAERVRELLAMVGLPEGAEGRFPHEFSGGQRQRIGIARALAPQPRFVVADEPVAALDVSIRAQILNLLADLQERFDLTLLLIAHDLAVVEQMADRIAILYCGRLVELASTTRVLRRPLHPYTANLLSALSTSDRSAGRSAALFAGKPASSVDPPSGCAFHPRCPIATDLCRRERPEMLEIETAHAVACHHPGELDLR